MEKELYDLCEEQFRAQTLYFADSRTAWFSGFENGYRLGLSVANAKYDENKEIREQQTELNALQSVYLVQKIAELKEIIRDLEDEL